ncbi:MAG: phosphodiester glycosidase family protein [Clostridia bacterium]|nr:phosphodiester glycosidase family protein [Clostridia bacterium]
MKKFLIKLAAIMMITGMLCAQTAAVYAIKELGTVDFSDRDYLLPINFEIQKQRAIAANFTETGYEDSTLSVRIETGRFEDRCDYWTADIVIKDPSQLRTSAAAKVGFLSKGTKDGVELCARINAVVGLNGDFVHGTEKYDFGYVIRQGVLYRNNLDTAGKWNSHLMDLLLIDEDGDFHIIRRAEAGAVKDMKIEGKRIMQAFTFGPALIIDGEKIDDFGGAENWINMDAGGPKQRIAFCQTGELHYKVVCCSGPYTNTRTKAKNTGLTLAEFASLVAEQDVQTAYNLDGGDSVLLYFNGRIVNEKPNQGTRKLQDVIYFVSAEGL